MNNLAQTSDRKLETLFGGRNVPVLLIDDSQQEIKVRQLRLVDYEKAYALIGDEFAFTAFCCLPCSVQPVAGSAAGSAHSAAASAPEKAMG